MTIRRKVPLFLALDLVSLLGCGGNLGVLLLHSFLKLEEADVRLNVERAGNALSDDSPT